MRSWYLPNLDVSSLWPCAVLLIVFIPVTIWHERNWRLTIAAYAEARRQQGASDAPWPPRDLQRLLALQPWLVITVAAMLGVMTGSAIWAALLWPRVPQGFDMAINYYDLPYVWSMVVAALAAVVAATAIAVDLLRSPWRTVAACIRHSMYTTPERRAELFARALASDPELTGQREEHPL